MREIAEDDKNMHYHIRSETIQDKKTAETMLQEILQHMLGDLQLFVVKHDDDHHEL